MNHLTFILVTNCIIADVSDGFRGMDTRIWNGQPLDYGQYKFAASLRFKVENKKGQHLVGLCSASVISNQWILTAAHCIEKAIEVRVSTPNSEVVSDHWSHPHPFDISGYPGDIGLVRIPPRKGPLNMLSLPSPGQDDAFIDSDRNVTIIGFGGTSLDPSNRSEGGMKVDAQFSWFCLSQDNPVTKHAGVLCIRYPLPFPFLTCGGDSGGPAFAETSSNRVVIAIYVGGTYSCNETVLTERREYKYPTFSMYTRVSTYVPWILHTIDQHSHDHGLEYMMNRWLSNSALFMPPHFDGD